MRKNVEKLLCPECGRAFRARRSCRYFWGRKRGQEPFCSTKNSSIAVFLVLLSLCGLGCSDGKKRQDKATKANYEKVTTFMAKDKVLDLLGPPASSMDTTDANGSKTTMSWSGKSGSFMLELTSLGVISKIATFQSESFGRGQGQGSATKANYERVTVGMTEAEVVDILGPPWNAHNEMDIWKDVTRMGWMGGEMTIMIELRDGKVASKTGAVRGG